MGLREKVRFRPWMVMAVVSLAYGVAILACHGWDPLAFAVIGTRFAQGDPAGTEGYDGQFAYQIAVHLTGASPYLDVPAYRYQRILYPLVARALALGNPDWVPWTLILVNWGALLVGTWLMERLLEDFGASRWYALGLGLYSGQLLAFRLDLNEPLATALVLAALWHLQREKWLWAGLWLALAALAKETSLVFTAGALAWLLWTRRFRTAGQVAAAALGPPAFYQVLLAAWLGRPGLGSGGAGATSFPWVPFGGLWAIAPYGKEVFALFLTMMVPWAVLPAVAGVVLSVRDIWRGERHFLPWLLLANSVAVAYLPFSTFREPLAMARLTVGLVLTTLCFGAWKGSRRTLHYALLWLATGVLLLKE
ncbi:MAG: hypothetical protein H5T59_04280 [Anaerolineae bacterium]|nr:hypothetical protein [Anaerolineae bacterium]